MPVFTIKPAAQKKFLRDARQYKGDPNGDRVQIGENKKLKFHGSAQTYRIKYSEQKRKWLIDLDEKRLQQIVKELELIHEYGPHEGDVITKASLTNDKCPFFNHSELFLLKEEGTATLDSTDLRSELMLASMRADLKYQVGASGNPAYSGLVQYKVEELGAKDKQDEVSINKEIEAVSAFSKMSHDMKLTVLRSLGRNVGKATPEQVHRDLYRLITRDKDMISPAKKTNLAHFLELAILSEEEMSVREAIAIARSKNVIKKHASTATYRMAEIILGKTLEDVNNFFTAKENEDLYAQLLVYIGQK